jgi:hypothetical protein
MLRRNLNQLLRKEYDLDEAIAVATDSDDDSGSPQSDHIGQKLARAAAGYLHERLISTTRQGKETRVGIAWGYVLAQIAEELAHRKAKEEERRARLVPHREPSKVEGAFIWCSLVGTLMPFVVQWEAAESAQKLERLYPGRVESFIGSGLEESPTKGPDPAEKAFADRLASDTDIILTSASHWHVQHSLITSTSSV